jgi:hypothetical protein
MEYENDKLLILDELTKYIEAISNIDCVKWLESMKSKMDFVHTN